MPTYQKLVSDAIADDGTLTYTREKPPTYHVAIFTLFGMLFGIGTGLIISDVILVPMLIGVFCGFVVGMLLDILDRKSVKPYIQKSQS